jgi:hypothetical protein
MTALNWSPPCLTWRTEHAHYNNAPLYRRKGVTGLRRLVSTAYMLFERSIQALEMVHRACVRMMSELAQTRDSPTNNRRRS